MSEKGIIRKAVDIPPRTNWIGGWLRWCPTSTELLEQAEAKMFSYLEKPPETTFVPINLNEEDGEYRIRTFMANREADEKVTPLVLLHGFASGIGLWVLNIDSLSQDRPLYALDILGFGLSSRPVFNRDAEVAENQFVESIEAWRKKVGLKKFILLGHSMGGFLATAYSIKYPERIQHLILADPWGFPTPDLSAKKVELPIWVKAIAAMLKPFNPLAGLRAAGPWGPGLVKRLRPDILRKFENIVADPSDVGNYIYHCNAQYPSGEVAFKAMSAPFGWANRPMIERISQLRQDIPVSFVYGARSWIDSSSGYKIREMRENSFVEIKLIQGAGHHVYADKADEFNEVVSKICKKADVRRVSTYSGKSTDISSATLNVDGGEEKIILDKVL
ncbi:1-acylglycerol-3-phosphate O-acyltransferase ABHD5-like isoform X2 [Argiope bruennichi]|uniref:1-acylglycerol-3-phosphate O-acyltransferase ABHD5 n=1 Tax=Argiope bruennichi TaxID=94029 RepID=A0A8T0F068_ARGBR|nr:1-acylglycerol-3-phosphate O-acyltransferase ABHD5-like isoform X2 [Argiope bruennichi]KAF8784526.1 (Lyso)-N-acylphosphatidylethanolamine lipase like protein [Argiope bruennichi]